MTGNRIVRVITEHDNYNYNEACNSFLVKIKTSQLDALTSSPPENRLLLEILLLCLIGLPVLATACGPFHLSLALDPHFETWKREREKNESYI